MVGAVGSPSTAARTKAQWRVAVLRARRQLDRGQHDAEAQALCAALPGLTTAGNTVCAYVPIGTEPGSLALVEFLAGLSTTVLLPVARFDADGAPTPLRWGRYRPGGLVDAPPGLREPSPPWLAPEAVADAAVVLVPALAVDRTGVRLGRGAGFYDRSLALADPAARLVAVVRDDELVDRLPADPHDVKMSHALTPERGLVALG